MTKPIYIAVFLTVFIPLILLFNYRVSASVEYGKQTTEYEEHLTKACNAAVDAAALLKTTESPYLYDTVSKRNAATEAFFRTLEQGFNLVNDSNQISSLRQHVPALCLVDMDGYYIYYNAVYKESDGYLAVKQVMSPLNTWGYVTPNERYIIRYYLSDYVEVTNMETGKSMNGLYSSVYDYFNDETGLSVLKDKETFELCKNDFIVSEVSQMLEYYINNYNQSVNRVSSGKINDYDIHYTFELSRVKYENWCNLLEKPSAMALLQGVVYNDGESDLNIYAMAGGEMNYKGGYYVDADMNDTCYHRPSCSQRGSDYIYMLSKRSCARKGYFPCEVCRP